MTIFVPFRPGLVHLRRLLGDRRDILDQASDVLEVAPGSCDPVPAAIALPNEFDRVSASVPTATLEEQWARLSAREFKHAPTVAYGLEDALVFNGGAYAGGAFYPCQEVRRRALARAYEEIDEAQLCTDWVVETFFGHWLRDGLCMELLASERDLVPLVLQRPPWLHESGYRTRCGLIARRTSCARVRKLWIVDDRGLNRAWNLRFQELRRRNRSVGVGGGPTHIFMSRGMRGKSRKLLNEESVVANLTRRGFVFLEPENMSADELAAALHDVKVLISVEGSALSHAQLTMPASSAMLTIQAPDHFNAIHKATADSSGISFAYVVGDPSVGGFSLCPERLLRTVDLVERALS